MGIILIIIPLIYTGATINTDRNVTDILNTAGVMISESTVSAITASTTSDISTIIASQSFVMEIAHMVSKEEATISKEEATISKGEEGHFRGSHRSRGHFRGGHRGIRR